MAGDESPLGEDRSAALAEQVRRAAATAMPLIVRGAGTRAALGHDAVGETLAVHEHTGIVSHEPTELVVTARAGTPIATLTAALAASGQMLPFEPPDEGGTLGGVIACGLSGPRRPYVGAARDFVLGTRVIDGRGRVLAFGGEVMKNVAGYDVSRVQVGAFGTLGVLLEISMKVLPRPETELTLHHELGKGTLATSAPGCADTLVAMARQPVPLGASMVHGSDRFVRLAGSRVAVEAAATRLGGTRVPEHQAPWVALRERTLAFFDEVDDERPLWRIALADHAPPLDLPGAWLLDWGGAQRWLRSAAPAREVFAAAAAAGGHARRHRRAPVRASEPYERVEGPLFQPIEGPMRRLQARLRDSFDPARLFNRGRFHPELDETPIGTPTGAPDGSPGEAGDHVPPVRGDRSGAPDATTA